MIDIKPKVVIGIVHDLTHGTPIILADGSLALVWRYAPPRQGGIPFRETMALCLTDFSSKRMHEVALNNTYVSVLSGDLDIVLDIASGASNIDKAENGDIVISAGEQKPLLVLTYGGEKYGFSFDADENTCSPIHPGYSMLFKRWRLEMISMGKGDEKVVLLDRS